MKRRAFLAEVFWTVAFKYRALVVGFNLPFDLARLAVGSGTARGPRMGGGFSLVLWEYECDGIWEENRYRPRNTVKSIDSKRSLIGFTKRHSPDPEDLIPHELRRELDEYFAGTRKAFDVPLVAPGTPFEERVWQALRAIPYGETRSYADIAREVGSPAAVRAVGRANGMNRIAVVIPCHRVVNKNGELGGYGGGLWRKRRLLHLEAGGSIAELFSPPDQVESRSGVSTR